MSLKNVAINFSISLGSAILMVILFEGIGYFFYQEPPKETCTNCRNYTEHPRLGLVNLPNSSHEAIKTCEEKPCYKAKYTYDDRGRRVVGNEKPSRQKILLFGCSFTFGEGLNDLDTVAYKIQALSNFQVRNYSRPAVGPAFALATMREKDFEKEIGNETGTAVFVLASPHLGRGSISTKRPWLWQTPGYQFDENGEITFEGFQSDLHPTYLRLFSFYVFLKKHSYFLKALDLNFETLSASEDYDLIVKTLLKMKGIYESNDRRRFIVVTHATHPISEELAKRIKEAQISLFQIEPPKAWPGQTYLCKCDLHPTGVVNDFMAEKILEAVNKEIQKKNQ